MIESRQRTFGPLVTATADPLAAACVGVALQVCEHAIDHDQNLQTAHQLAARFVEGAFRTLDRQTRTPNPPRR